MSVDELKQLQQERYCGVSTRKNKHEESRLQIACVKWFRMQYPFPKYLISSEPNGGWRKEIEAKIMKAEGCVAGLPDLVVFKASKGYHGLFIEMKNGTKGRVSDNQKIVMDYLAKEGYKCAVCRDFESFQNTVNDYLR